MGQGALSTQAREQRGLLCSPAMMDLARKSLQVVLSHGEKSLKTEQTRSKPRPFSVWVHREP